MAKLSEKKPTLLGLPRGGLSYLDVIGGAEVANRPIATDWFLQINGNLIPTMDCAELLIAAEAACPGSLDVIARKALFNALDQYYVARWAAVTSVKASQIERTLKEIDSACERLMAAIEITGQSSILAWDRLENVEPDTLKRDDVYPMISMLRNRSHRCVDSLTEDFSSGNSVVVDQTAVWDQFVRALRDIFHANRWNVSVSKSKGQGERVGTEHPSKFAHFAWASVKRLPLDIREHSSSIWSLADALSKSLKRIRASEQ